MKPDLASGLSVSRGRGALGGVNEFIERPTVQAHREVAAVLRSGELAIDATAGNGYDTVFLAGLVGAGGRVLAFDVQAEAIAAARVRVQAAGFGERVEFIEASHAVLADHVPAGRAAAVMFNLGYFPGGDPTVITQTDETLRALAAARLALRPGGVLTVVCYPGHPGGDEEADAVLGWAASLDPASDEVECFRRLGTLRPAPFLVRLLRRGGGC